MRHGIPEFRPRQALDRQLSSGVLNRILRELESLRITRVVNGTFTKLPGGTEIVVSPQRRGGTGFTPQPWDLIARRDPEADPRDKTPPYLVTVRPGTLNGFLSTNWDIEETLQYDDTIYYAKAIVQTDGQNITSVSIAIDDQPPAAQTPEKYAIQEEIEVLFGLFCNGVTYRTIAEGAINLLPEQWIITSAEPPAQPGESPYDIYYRLQ